MTQAKEPLIFVYFWPSWVFDAACGLYLAAQASHCDGFSCCTAWAPGHRAQQLRLPGSRAHDLQLCTGLVALQHVGSSRIRDRTHVPCVGRRILYHWITGEVLLPALKLETDVGQHLWEAESR